MQLDPSSANKLIDTRQVKQTAIRPIPFGIRAGPHLGDYPSGYGLWD